MNGKKRSQIGEGDFTRQANANAEERRTIRFMQRVVDRWPSNLGLYTCPDGVRVVRLDKDGNFPPPGQELVQATLYLILGIKSGSGPSEV
jgi:hypothetical protein